MKRAFVAVGILIVVVVAGGLALPFLIDVNQFRPVILSQLQQRLRRPVSMGQMGLNLIPLSVRVDNLVIGESPSFGSTRRFATAKALFLRVGIFRLLRGEVSVESLRLRQPVIELIRNPRGEWNYFSLGGDASSSGSGQSLSLAEFEIEDGRIAITDELKREPRAVYDHIDLRLRDYVPGRTFDVALTLRLPGSGSQRVELSGRGGGLSQGNVNFDGRVRLQEASLAGLRKILRSDAGAAVDAVATGDTTISSKNNALRADGNITLAGLRVRGRSLDEKLSARYTLTGDLAQQSYQVTQLNLGIGDLSINVAGQIDAARSPAAIGLAVNTQDASIGSLARLAYAFGGPQTDIEVDGRLSAKMSVRGTTARPELSGTVSALSIQVRGKGWKQPVRASEVSLTLSPDAIRSNEFTLEAGGTRLAASFAVNQYSGQTAGLQAAVRANQAKLDELLSIAAAVGAITTDPVSGTGAVSMDLRVEGPLRGTQPLSFSGSGSLQNASLQVSALTKPLRIASAAVRFEQNSARLENVAVSLGSSNARGQLTVRDFANPRVEFQASIDQLNVTEIQQLKAQGPAGAGRGKQAEPSRLTGSGRLAVGKLLLSQLTLNNVQATCLLDRGLIRLDPVSAEIYGGRQTGVVTIDTRGEHPVNSVRTKLENVDANQLLSSVTAWKGALQGRFNLDANAQFTALPDAPPARTLTGDVGFRLENGKLSGVSLVNELAGIGRFLRFSQQSAALTDIVHLSGTMNIKDGLGRTEDLRLQFGSGSLSAAGLINLLDQSVNLKVLPVLDRDFSSRVGGSQIGGWLTTALANNKGELVIPCIVSGVFPTLRFQPDAQRLAELRLKSILPSTAEPAKVPPDSTSSPTSATQTADPKAPPSKADPTRPLRDLFEQLKSRRPKREEQKQE